MMMKRILYLLLFISLILLIPFAIQQLIQYRQLPKSITIATGKEGGRYKDIAQALGDRIRAEHGIKVIYKSSPGSEANIGFVQNGEADFAFFQPNVIKETSDFSDVRMIANVFPEVILTHVRKGLGHDPFVGKLEERKPNTLQRQIASAQPLVAAHLPRTATPALLFVLTGLLLLSTAVFLRRGVRTQW